MSSEEGWHLRRPQYTDVLRDENLLVLHIVFLHPLAGELFGVPLVDGDGDQVGVDDVLSDDEMEILCGTYRVCTG